MFFNGDLKGCEVQNPGLEMRTKHKNGESYYWILYYSFLSLQQLQRTAWRFWNIFFRIKNIIIIAFLKEPSNSSF